MEYSNCCGSGRWLDETDRCGECKEHAVFEEIEE